MIGFKLDYFSTCASHISLSFGDTKLAHGTGFFYSRGDRIYFVTALHNFTGTEWRTGRNLSTKAGRPDRFNMTIPLEIQRGGDVLFNRLNIQILLNINDVPIWHIHPRHGAEVDVAVLDMTGISELPDVYPEAADFSDMRELFEKGNSHEKVKKFSFADDFLRVPFVNKKMMYYPDVGQDVFVVGYPLDFAGQEEFPIWKRGSVASEPVEDYRGLPFYLIDAMTREGLSGSPVIGDFVNPAFPMPRGVLTRIGTERAFAGVYTSRLGARDDFSAQVGIVWKQQAVDEIIDGANG